MQKQTTIRGKGIADTAGFRTDALQTCLHSHRNMQAPGPAHHPA